MSSFALHVERKERDFTIIKNSIVRDGSIKPTARILLIFLIGCDEENFRINTKSLAKSIGVGVSAITSASKELQGAGYLIIDKLSDGKCVWNIFECPLLPEEPDLEKPDMEKPYMENQDALRSNNIKEELNNKNMLDKSNLVENAFEAFWQVWSYCKKGLGVRNNSSKADTLKRFKKEFNQVYFKKHTIEEFKLEINNMCRYTEEAHSVKEQFNPFKNMGTGKFITQKGWRQ